MQLLKDTEVKKAIAQIEPYKIAVAYLGSDWKTFLTDEVIAKIKFIIISPTIGTNPDAVSNLVKSISWDRVLFLDKLHAKAYVGKGGAVVGSANLTKNGLSGNENGLIELCVKINDKKSIKDIEKFIDGLKKEAEKAYPEEIDKKKRLAKLKRDSDAAIVNRVIKKQGKVKQFNDFELLGNDDFYVSWWYEIDYEHSDNVKEKFGENSDEAIEDEILFRRDDKLINNKWILCWKINKNGQPSESKKSVSWLYIHEVFDNGVKVKGKIYHKYPKLAVQIKKLEVPQEPFELTEEVQVSFKGAVKSKDIRKYFIQDFKNDDKNPYDLNFSKKGLPKLIEKMKEIMAENK